MKKYPAASDFVGSPIQTAWYPVDSALVRQASLPPRACEYNTSIVICFCYIWFTIAPRKPFKHETDPQLGEASKVWKMKKMKRLWPRLYAARMTSTAWHKRKKKNLITLKKAVCLLFTISINKVKMFALSLLLKIKLESKLNLDQHLDVRQMKS